MYFFDVRPPSQGDHETDSHRVGVRHGAVNGKGHLSLRLVTLARGNLTETIIVLFKTEVIRRGVPRCNIDVVEYATLEWVNWFSHHRLLIQADRSRDIVASFPALAVLR